MRRSAQSWTLMFGLLAFISGCGFFDTPTPPVPKEGTAKVQLTRTSNNWNARAVDFGVTINGEKVGAIDNGATIDFPFTPKPEGNTLVVSGFGLRSGTLTFKATAGQVVSAICEVGWVSINVSGDASSILDSTPATGIDLVNTNVDSNVIRVKVDSEVVTVPRGVKRTVRKSRTITRTLEAVTTTNTGADAGVNFGPLISAKIQGEIEEKLGRTFQKSETVEQTVEMDGNVHQRFQLTWYDRFRTGKISYRENGTPQSATFRFREGTELEVSELK